MKRNDTHQNLLQEFYITFPRGNIIRADDKVVEFKRSEDDNVEIYVWRTFAKSISAVKKYREYVKTTFDEQGVKALIPIQNLNRSNFKFSARCGKCREEFLVNKVKLDNAKKRNSLICVSCNRHRVQAASKKRKFASYSDLMLLNIARKIYRKNYAKLGGKYCSSEFSGKNLPLYLELKKRKLTPEIISLFKIRGVQFRSKHSSKYSLLLSDYQVKVLSCQLPYEFVPSIFFKNLYQFFRFNFTEWRLQSNDFCDFLATDEQWDSLWELATLKFPIEYEFNRSFDGKGSIKDRAIQSSQYQRLREKFFGLGDGFIGKFDICYRSISEALVGNFLFLFFKESDLVYEQEYPFLGKAQNESFSAKSDFYIRSQKRYVEVWMHPLDHKDKGLDQTVDDYLEGRIYKTKQAQNRHLKLLSVESDVYISNKMNIHKYLEHVLEVFINDSVLTIEQVNSVGIKLIHDKGMSFDIPPSIIKKVSSIKSSPYRDNWTVEKWFNYFRLKGYRSIAEFNKNEHFRFSSSNPELSQDLVTLLRHERGKRYVCRKDLISVDDLRSVCEKLKITTRSQYEKAYKLGMLPKSAPSGIHRAYGIPVREFFKGFSVTSFVSYDKAKLIVKAAEITDKEDFYRRRQESEYGDPLLSVRGDPSNQHSGGYKDWVSWSDFLGKKAPFYLTGEAAGIIEALVTGSKGEVIKLLQSKKIKKISEINNAFKLQVLEKYLATNTCWLEIQLNYFGNIRIKDKISETRFFTQFIKPDWVRSKAYWVELQQKHPAYKIFTSHPERMKGIDSGSWVELREQTIKNHKPELNSSKNLTINQINDKYQMWLSGPL